MKLKTQALRCLQCHKYIGYAEVSDQIQAYCSKRCKKKGQKYILPAPDPTALDLNTLPLRCSIRKGAYAELLASAALLARGYDVYRSLSPAAKCDLVIVKGKSVLKIEVRTGKGSNGSLVFGTKRRDNADFYAVYHLDNGIPRIAFKKAKKLLPIKNLPTPDVLGAATRH